MSKREAKIIERAAFERGIITAAAAGAAGILGYGVYTGTLGFVSMCYCLLMAAVVIRGGRRHGTL